MKDIADFDIAPKSEKAQVEGEEDNTEVDETTGGESESKKHIYQEMLKNKKIIYVAGRLMLIFCDQFTYNFFPEYSIFSQLFEINFFFIWLHSVLQFLPL